MAEITVHAIVLRRRDSGETDRRLTLLTREHGKIDAIAKGARKAASRLAGVSDPLSVATMSLATGKKNLFVTQAQPHSSFRGLRTDFERLTFGLALCELYAAVCPYEQPFPEAFDLLFQSLRALEHHPKPLVALVWAELKLLFESGFFPQLDQCASTGEPIREGMPFLSPRAGGYVSDAASIEFVDRVRVRAEAVYGMTRTVELDEPPGNLRFADECLVAILPFWRHVAEFQLPANESVVAEIRHAEREP